MFSLNNIAEILGRDRVYLLGQLKRFELPTFPGAEYPEIYASFLRVVVFLRLAQVSEVRILELWSLERKLMTMLNAESLGSPTWMIDGHSQEGGEARRLFLSRFDVGADLMSSAVQPGLDFSTPVEELFASQEMGEDALRLLQAYVELLTPIRRNLSEQAEVIQAAARWARRAGQGG